ncbi:MAG TPA: hypothetical protein VFU47_00830 [Armatimonadota bacterium]|nr:hypothetical protein [Armatimonadota bacterium]
MNMARLWLAVVALPALLLSPAAPARAQGPVPPGTPVMLQFMEPVSTKTAKKDDRIPLRVYTNVVVNGKTLIRQDAPATGIVTSVKKPGRFGKRGELKIRLESVTDVNGNRVPLEQYASGDRFTASGPGASAGGLVVLGPVGLVGGAFVKGKHVTIDKGTRIQAKVAGGEKPAKKNEAPPVENP